MFPKTIDVLLIEDNPADARLFAEALREPGARCEFRLRTAARLDAGLKALAEQPAHVIVTDLSLPDSSGLEGLGRLAEAAPGVPIVVLTGMQDEALAHEALRQGVQDYLVKGQSEGGIVGRALRYAVERQRVEEKLRDREARLAAIVETAVDAMVTIDERGTIDWVNPATERLFGYSRAELIGQNVRMLMPEPYRGEHDDYLGAYLGTGVRKIIGVGREVPALRKDGTTVPVSLAVSEMRVGHARMFTAVLHDLSRRRALERQVLETAAAEQRRIGHDLHDGLCQELVSISMGLALMTRKLNNKGLAAEAAGLEKLTEAVSHATGQARRLAHGLKPVDVEGGGLTSALERLAQRIHESTGITCSFRGDRAARVDDGNIATHLYLIAQEATGNAVKHAKASTIELRLLAEPGLVKLEVADDGVGMRPGKDTRHVDPNRAAGIGMQTMAFRAGLVGGTLDVRAHGTRGGTVVTCAIPAVVPPPKRRRRRPADAAPKTT